MKLFTRRFVSTFATLVITVGFLSPALSAARADTFGSGANTFEIEFVSIGDPNNLPDVLEFPFNRGSVPYRYRIGKFEISEAMIDKANALGGLGLTHDNRGPDQPATSVSWFEAAQFVNWLNTSTDNEPAYKFVGSGTFQLWEPDDAGYNPNNRYRNRLAKYVLPSDDEWYKAAYFDPNAGVYFDYPTGSDTVPDGIDFVGDPDFDAVFFDGGGNSGPNVITDVGVLSPYGTAGQGGNVREWQENAFDLENNDPVKQRSARGGSWSDIFTLMNASNSGIGTNPQIESTIRGFRVLAVPEPPSLMLVCIALIGKIGIRIRVARSRTVLMKAKSETP